MAHFALIEAGIVREVMAVANQAVDDKPYPESEPLGQQMLAESGFLGQWLQCSYSASFRGAFPGQGWTYDQALNVFVSPAVPEIAPE